jgi:hypothetical protein
MSTPAAKLLGMNSRTRPEPGRRSRIPTGPRVGLWGINANPRLHQRHHRGHGWAAVARVCSQSVPEPPPASPLLAPHRSRSLSPTCRQTMRRPSKYLTLLRFPSVLPGSSPGGPTRPESWTSPGSVDAWRLRIEAVFERSSPTGSRNERVGQGARIPSEKRNPWSWRRDSLLSAPGKSPLRTRNVAGI